jgi:hypothetical protein
MNKFQAQRAEYRMIDGTSALKKPAHSHDSYLSLMNSATITSATIIEFPSEQVHKNSKGFVFPPSFHAVYGKLRVIFHENEMIKSLRQGSSKGSPFNVFKRKEIVAVGCLFFTVALCFIFIGY